MKITLKDGSVKEYASPMSIIDIAKDISEGLARVACLGEVDGEEEDLRTVIDHDCQLNILTAKDEKGLAALRHTASHVMAQAVKRLYPETKLAIGPSIADGFYYDVDPATPLTAEDLPKIEAEMKKIIKEALPLERFTLPRNEAIEFMKLHELDRFISRQSKALQWKCFFDDFLHLCLDLRQILCSQRGSRIDIIVETVCDGRSNRKFCLRVKAFYSLCHYMAGGMAQSCQTFLILCSQDI